MWNCFIVIFNDTTCQNYPPVTVIKIKKIQNVLSIFIYGYVLNIDTYYILHQFSFILMATD